MRIVKVMSLSLVGVFAVASVQAATFVPPVMKVDSMIEQAKKGKKKAKPGKCGTYMYFDKKTKKCADARLKK